MLRRSHRDSAATVTTQPPTEEVTDEPPTTQPPTTSPPESPCTNQGTNGIGVENKVRYFNGGIFSSTTGLRNAQSWHSCCDSCWANINCAAFSFEQTSSTSLCELTTLTTVD
ncbi:uncharacterized protein PITG_18930 [Phytophthora infestans T30-4]|uniref:Apple domain-containing protein n=2 Tax=Phytophthora infestans TaxID=4787 RepID=D0P016_PHYIT|nr:uncharacterized protein PITG_18930 [Phytophthora infestans T30-4]EEY70176.1 hypothetical protein PITG_18930 [Phytophthora infestans T30-4]KAF4035574.1 hypothetical protein GN244_ATG12414 [Phytophthora infestans]KAF4144000.1 hypothetical protein GN958_ATG06811 [Phytophthora infestans]|eukprot:XP_002997037.1 hypothetical protein PITG_18930 [Phytophthora infestans T30-4]